MRTKGSRRFILEGGNRWGTTNGLRAPFCLPLGRQLSVFEFGSNVGIGRWSFMVEDIRRCEGKIFII